MSPWCSRPRSKEILLVDDGSVDRTREIIRELEAKHPEIRAIFHSENKGKGGALATAASRRPRATS
ncbi:MAG: glycosyltransferase [Planctomycetota bacterium]